MLVQFLVEFLRTVQLGDGVSGCESTINVIVRVRGTNFDNRNVPIGAVAFVLLSFYLKAELRNKSGSVLSKRAKLERLDPAGVILIFGSICCLLLALQWGGIQFSWSSSRIIGLLVGCVLLFAMFCIVQYRLGEKATIPPRLLRHRTIFCGSLSSFFITMSNNTVSCFW